MATMTRPNPAYKRGDVILVLFPDSNLLTAKLRPGLIIQADNLQTGLQQVIVVMISSGMYVLIIPAVLPFYFLARKDDNRGYSWTR